MTRRRKSVAYKTFLVFVNTTRRSRAMGLPGALGLRALEGTAHDF